jgi:bifunctional ADP-heptose synthase (sugar kinase/adenylyltransferase)
LLQRFYDPDAGRVTLDGVPLRDADPAEVLTRLIAARHPLYAEADIVGAEFVRARGGRILRASLVDGQSTSRIVQKTART